MVTFEEPKKIEGLDYWDVCKGNYKKGKKNYPFILVQGFNVKKGDVIYSITWCDDIPPNNTELEEHIYWYF
jgi:hypothetical protein